MINRESPCQWRHVSVMAGLLFAADTVLAGTYSAETFGELPDGQPVKLFTLDSGHGVQIKLSEFGATLTSVKTPDRNGDSAVIVLGHDSLAPYIGRAQNAYFGPIVGRYANRIANAQFTIDGKVYKLPANDGDNSIHGGTKGFDQRFWQGTPFSNSKGVGVDFTYTSADGEEGYPGKLDVHVRYTLGDDNTVTIQYEAVTDKPTYLNLTNHTYWNLSGDPSQGMLDHEIRIPASRLVAVDKEAIPTGELMPVKGTPMDFIAAHKVGERIYADNQQMKNVDGYDFCWVMDGEQGAMKLAAEVYHAASGRVLKVLTNQPCVQFYSGNSLDGSITGRGGIEYKKHAALALETQHYPDSPHHDNFPTTLLEPGETFRSETIYRFSTDK